ncbi:MAG: hypothetical protein Q4A52_04320 [Bacillota bacterium]|nr:hypothetical protein [Bacillota bacterium]
MRGRRTLHGAAASAAAAVAVKVVKMEAEANIFVRIIETQGFAIVFGVAVMWGFYKFAPKFLAVWTEFTKATVENTNELRTVSREVNRAGE